MGTVSSAGIQPDHTILHGNKEKRAPFFHAHITTNRLKIQVLFCCHGRRMLGDGGGRHGISNHSPAAGDRTDFSGSKPPDGPLRPDVDARTDDGSCGKPGPRSA